MQEADIPEKSSKYSVNTYTHREENIKVYTSNIIIHAVSLHLIRDANTSI